MDLKNLIIKVHTLLFIFIFLLMSLSSNAGLPMGDMDFMNDPEFAKMMEEFERELASLSPEERQQFDEMVNEFQRVLEEMPEEEFEKLIADINQDLELAAQSPEMAALPKEIMPTAAPVVEIPEEIKTLAEVIQAIKTNLSMLLTKVQIAPELSMKITKWMYQGKITNVPADYSWQQCNADIEKLISLLSYLLETDKKMRPVFLFSLHENKELENILIQFSSELLEVSSIEILEFGVKQTKYTNQLIINILSIVCEKLFAKNITTELDKIYQKHITEIAGKKPEEKIPQMPKETFAAQPVSLGGEETYGRGLFEEMPSYTPEYGYGKYPSEYPSYESFEPFGKEMEKEKEGGKKGSAPTKKAEEEKEEKEKEKGKEKGDEILKEIKQNQTELQLELSKAITIVETTELSAFKTIETKEEAEENEKETKEIKKEQSKEEIIQEARKLYEQNTEDMNDQEYKEWHDAVLHIFNESNRFASKETEEERTLFTHLSNKDLAEVEKRQSSKEKTEKALSETSQLSAAEDITEETVEKFVKQLEVVKKKAKETSEKVNKLVKKKKEEMQTKITEGIQDDVFVLDSLLQGLTDLNSKKSTVTLLISALKETLKSLDPLFSTEYKEEFVSVKMPDKKEKKKS